MISDTPDNEARPHFTMSKAVFEEEQRKDDLIDLNNKSINKRKQLNLSHKERPNLDILKTHLRKRKKYPIYLNASIQGSIYETIYK